jgi:alpha-L-fucosidase 2
VTPNGVTGALDILNSCAQELCGGGPDGENNPHPDIAYLTAMLQALLRWSAQLGVDADKRPVWQGLLDGLAPLPTGTHAGEEVWLEANGTAANFLSNAAAYTIVYYAALHPAQVVSLSSDAATVATAWNTVSQVNAVAAWHPVNGLCMAWPPATRVAGAARAAQVLDSFEDALSATMNNNFFPDLNGGGIEQFGATEAVNSALLQSQEGFIRLFPMWPVAENASFTTLRARGAFLVSAAFAGGATAAPVLVRADDSFAAAPPARNCSLLDPWAAPGAPPPWRPLVVRDASGALVAVAADPAWALKLPVWLFAARSGENYTVWPPEQLAP